MNAHVIDTALGNIPADIVIKNGNLINVITHEIYRQTLRLPGNILQRSENWHQAVLESTQKSLMLPGDILPLDLLMHIYILKVVCFLIQSLIGWYWRVELRLSLQMSWKCRLYPDILPFRKYSKKQRDFQ